MKSKLLCTNIKEYLNAIIMKANDKLWLIKKISFLILGFDFSITSVTGVVGASCHTLRNELVELFFVHIGVFVVAEGFIVGVK